MDSVMTNATRQQEMLARFEQKGIDTTGLESAFASGNLTAVRTWLDANRPIAAGSRDPAPHLASVMTNTTFQQEMLARFEQKGIDTTGLKAAFASGNLTAVKVWMDANRPIHNTMKTSIP